MITHESRSVTLFVIIKEDPLLSEQCMVAEQKIAAPEVGVKSSGEVHPLFTAIGHFQL